MIKNFFSQILILMLCHQLVLVDCLAANDKPLFEISVRAIHFDREYAREENNREQSGFSFIADYQSAPINDVIQFGASAYISKNTAAHGRIVEDVFAFENGRMKDSVFLGQAYLFLMPIKGLALKVGRQKHKSMLLKSNDSRALPATFQGVHAVYEKDKQIRLHAAIYNKWSRRSREKFEGFATDQSKPGDVDYIAIFGGHYKTDKFILAAEYLQSKDYLDKWGLEVAYQPEMNNDYGKLRLSAGLYTSSDAGSLFVAGAENGELDDEDQVGIETGITRIRHNGLGGYVQAQLKIHHLTYVFAYTQIADAWLEDSFAGDHGSTRFPTKTMGPELTNTGESVWLLKYQYDWKNVFSGLRTTIAYANGTGAENSVSKEQGIADENWLELDIKYKIPWAKGLKFRTRYRDYNSDKQGSVDGVKGDRSELRVYLDYNYSF